MPTATPNALLRLCIRAALAVLLATGMAVLSLCHTGTVPSGATAVVSHVHTDGTATEGDITSGTTHEGEHDSCDESGSPIADQRAGGLSVSALLGLGVFAFAGLRLLPPRPTTGLVAPVRHSCALPLGGTRALVSLCVRRM